ncbi:MAG: RnfABCDGE type electron transport complex subunit D [Clostridia bacterium]|nr:RnfABCDGE type electron transport complex subunit D [Clostridia bacterium]
MKLNISTAPHIHASYSTQSIMRDVLIALLPTTVVGVYLFGLNAALHVLVGIAGAVISELLFQKIAKKNVRINDLSAAVTGLLLALNMPAAAPWWVTLIGSVFAIVIVKQLFGGIGDNFLNPALAARAVLLASWPAHMTSFTLPTMFSGADAVSSATSLAGAEFSIMDMFLGNIPGTIGEVSKVAIILGFIYLLVRKVIGLHIPIVMLGVLAASSFIFGDGSGAFTGDPLMAVLSGGALFGAVFMATDYTTSPMTKKGQIIYAAGCGLLVAVIRSYGSYSEGVTYAILIMNIVTPLIDKYVKPKRYGEVKQNA